MMTCNLEWKNQSAFLVQALSSLRQNDTLTDCTLAADGRHIKAHRLILCACSPYFKELLADHCDKQAIIFLNNVNYSLLKLIVEYIYKGCVNIDHTELQKFLQTARALKISGLVNYGEEEPQTSKKANPPPKLIAQKPSQKRSLGDAVSIVPPKMNKLSKKEVNTPSVHRPVIRPRKETMAEAPLAPNAIQAAYLTLELEVDPTDENPVGEAEEEEHDENLRSDENIPFVTDVEGRYQPIEGRRRGSNLIADIQEGYVYRIRRYFNGKQYYRCCYKEKCPGRLVCDEGRFHALNQHDHDGDMHVVQNYKLVADCRSRAINETTPVSQIIQEEVDKATGISEVLVTPRYLVKTRRLHRQRLHQQQSTQEMAEGSQILPHAAKIEIEEEDEAGSLIIPSESE
ncbi:hypothetical protein GHT06_013215 [Daphnia sinensis]|uniref:BTB domain-containing protein n=1 Tax=Daphnia sinensis TaxID=1820382 RepID=A0AAD5LHR0_9CRUS|nr:hypothetical protein GHT06_013215 [Daphnia sinensis]